MAAERLLRGHASEEMKSRALRVTIFEEKPGWEKPCGGGLSHKALKSYPFLLNEARLAKYVRRMEMYGPKEVGVSLTLREPLAIYSRRELNHLLLERSQCAGAHVINDRIVSINRASGKWRLQGRLDTYEADFLVLASGARSALRNELAGPLRPQDFMLTFGYFAPGRDDRLIIEFFDEFEGYAWSFPRPDHLSVGICGKVGHVRMLELQQKLHRFMSRHGFSIGSANVFSHLLPSLEPDSWKNIALEGPGWALAGDVAGLADPITGEGLYYALRSGELLAESILKGIPYARSAWNEFGARLMLGAQICSKFYRGRFLGAGVTTRMVQFCSRSRTFSDLFQDLVEGRQAYSGLRNRAVKSLPKSLIELFACSFRKHPAVQSAERL
jgi:flavin-dependent dehydrogenase